MIVKLRSTSFSAKLVMAYIATLMIIVFVVTFEQIETSVNILESEKLSSLDMLTEYVSTNFEKNMDDINDVIYARLGVFEIPRLMSSYAANPAGGTTLLKYALAQTVSSSTGYDYIEIEMSDGERLHTPQNTRMSNAEYSGIVSRSGEIIDSTATSRYLKSQYFASADGSIFILRNIYSTSPLQWVGRAVIHMKPGFFSVNESDTDTGYLFFDKDGNYLTYAGRKPGDGELEHILSARGTENDRGGDFFVSESSSGDWTAVGYTSKDVFHRMRGRIVTVGLIYGLIGLVVGITLMLLLVRSLTRKLNAMKDSMARVAAGNLNSRIEITDNDDISRMASTFNDMTDRIHCLIDEVAEKERAKKDAELQILEYKYRSLETQIRPHFIYNAFEVVNAMAKIKGEEEIVEIVQRISRYFRNITVNTTKQFITTQQEFDALQDYTEIYRLIHGERLTVTFSARDAARNAMIPTMIVQPIVENSLKHGIRSGSENSEIIVHAYIQDETLNLTVKDTGLGLTPEIEYKLEHSQQLSDNRHGGIGLGNVRERLSLIYGDNASFTIHNRPEGGVIVKIVIPLSYSEPVMHFEEDKWDFEP